MLPLVNLSPPIKLQLARDLVKTIKRGHAWVYADSLRQTPKAQPGTQAILYDNRGGKEIARGYYDPQSPIALRICSTEPGEELDNRWAYIQLEKAVNLRYHLIYDQTTAFRLFNGEGDGLPGLVCDIYGEYAILKLDGPGAEGFWNMDGIANWLIDFTPAQHVYQQFRARGKSIGKALIGPEPIDPVHFFENGVQFTADLIHGQKTGFFLDQRENRTRIKSLSHGKRVLNVFGYTGGFSVYAGLGGAEHVTTVDTAKPALDLADHHWSLNGLTPEAHQSVAMDAFEFLGNAQEKWNLVILDPPSFAPSEATVPQAINAYKKLIAKGAMVNQRGGILAAASCSSHVNQELFLEICEKAISQARRMATILGIHGQPPDHPSPLVMPELRYLKFVLMQLD